MAIFDLKKFWNWFVLLRPYSLVDLFLVFVAARTIALRNISFDIKDVYLFVPVFFVWCYITWLLEAEHKHKFRENVPYWLSLIAILISAIIGITANVESLLFVLVVVIATNLYIKKGSISILGRYSFFFRGLMEVGTFFFALSLFEKTSAFSLEHILFGLVVLIVYSARSLIGDIRDTQFDKITFPATYGNTKSYLLSIILFLIGALVLVNISSSIVVFPIILFAVTLVFYDNGYELHRATLPLTSIVLLTYTLFIVDKTPIVLLDVLFVAVLSNFVFYNYVPRESNPVERVKSRFSFILTRKK